MQLAPKRNALSQFFFELSNFRLNFEHLQEKDDPHSWYILELMDSERRGYINVWKVPFQKIRR